MESDLNPFFSQSKSSSLANSLVSIYKMYPEPDPYDLRCYHTGPSHTISHLVCCDTLLPDSVLNPVQSILNPEPIVIQLKQNKRLCLCSAEKPSKDSHLIPNNWPAPLHLSDFVFLLLSSFCSLCSSLRVFAPVASSA